VTDVNENLSVITSFNERMFRNPHQQITDCMNTFNSDVPFYVYHENSYDKRKFDTKIDLATLGSNCTPVDLFDSWEDFPKLENDWLEKFVDSDSSPFNDGTGMWNLNAKYWFRKVAAWYHFSKICKTKYFLWLDSDITFVKRRPIHDKTDKSVGIDSQFFDFIKAYDTCFIDRPLRQQGEHEGFIGSPPETGIVTFNLENPDVVKFIDEIFYLFLDGKIFTDEPRWDDTWAFGKTFNSHYKDTLSWGIFNNKAVSKDLPYIEASRISEFDVYNDYFHHFKNNIDIRMLPHERIKLPKDT
jgi:hypothetical protein